MGYVYSNVGVLNSPVMVRFACAINKASGKYAEMRRTMSQKKTFVTLEQLKEINDAFEAGVNLLPYIRKSFHGVHLYDEKGIRANAERLKKAFSWNKGYREYFAVKATPNPFILNILKEYYPNKDVYSLMSREVLLAGGNIHCVTMQIPGKEE